MKAPGCASALEVLKPEDGAGAEAVTGAAALEPPKAAWEADWEKDGKMDSLTQGEDEMS